MRGCATRSAAWLAVAVLGACQSDLPDGLDTTRVAAAANLAAVMEELARGFSWPLTVSLAASGVLAKQINEGAPFDVFLSADVEQLDAALATGACEPTSRAIYARGRLSVVSAPGVVPVVSLGDLADERFRKIAIANPETAPYGRAARDALTHLGVWPRRAARIVYAENIQQALAFAKTGSADAALVAASLALSFPPAQRFDVPTDLHAPIDQALAVCRGGKNLAGGQALARYVLSDVGQNLFAKHGYAKASIVAARP